MAPSMAVSRTCCCFNVRIATTALAIYHVVSVGQAEAVCAPVGVRACVCVCECVRASDLLGPPATHHLSVGPCWSLGLLLRELGARGPCSSPLSRTVVEGGSLLQENVTHILHEAQFLPL